MTVVKFAISMEKELAKKIRGSAAGEPISTWLADAARRKLQNEGLRRVIEDWEAEHGEITEEEMQEARRRVEEARQQARRKTRQRARRG